MSVLRSVVYTPVSRRGHSGGIPNRADAIAYFKIVDGDVTESIGLSGITITRVSGIDASDLVVEIYGALALLGIADGTQMSWVAFQTACDGNAFIFAAEKGCLAYSTDQTSIATKIINWLGGLYVAPEPEQAYWQRVDNTNILRVNDTPIGVF